MKVITRFPPSPTGNLHIGGARTALFNFLFTQHLGGTMYLRLENTDEERSKKEYEENILEALNWLGLAFDNHPDGKPFWRQSERKDVYRAHLKKLVEEGKAFVSKEAPTPSVSPPRAGGEGRREEVIRFKNPNKKIAFDDLIRGRIEFDTTDLGDFVIAKSLQEPLYHLAVVIDDAEMGVTHVIRGEDHISNTPRQILMQEALGFARPQYAHIPLILAPDRSKLSKRHGAVAVTEYRDKGILPDALVNYLALLGWNPGSNREIFTLQELTQSFDIQKVQKGGAIFSEEKLRSINREYLKKNFSSKDLEQYIPASYREGKSPEQIEALTHTLFERIHTFADVEKELQGELAYLEKDPALSAEKLAWKKQSKAEAKRLLLRTAELLEAVPVAQWSKEGVSQALLAHADTEGKGNVLWPMRYALSGAEKSPDPFTLAAILGKETTLGRLRQASAMLE